MTNWLSEISGLLRPQKFIFRVQLYARISIYREEAYALDTFTALLILTHLCSRHCMCTATTGQYAMH